MRDMNIGHESGGCVLDPTNGKIYAFGGRDGHGDPPSSVNGKIEMVSIPSEDSRKWDNEWTFAVNSDGNYAELLQPPVYGFQSLYFHVYSAIKEDMDPLRLIYDTFQT